MWHLSRETPPSTPTTAMDGPHSLPQYRRRVTLPPAPHSGWSSLIGPVQAKCDTPPPPVDGTHSLAQSRRGVTLAPSPTVDGTHSLPQSRRAVMWRFTSFIRSWVRWPTSTCRRRSRISFMMCHSRWKRSPSFLWEVHRCGIGGQSPEWVAKKPRRKGKDQSSLPSTCLPLCGQILC